jgi:hypothetical protein
VAVDQQRPRGQFLGVVAGQMDLAHRVQREGGQIGAGVEAVVGGRDEDVVDVEQQPAAGAAHDLGQEIGLGQVEASKVT